MRTKCGRVNWVPTMMNNTMIDLNRPLVNFDLEATGTDPESARIIQVAAKRFPDEEEFIRTVNPGFDVPEEILDLTGLTQLELDSSAPWEVVGDQFGDFISDADLMGYNIVSYDWPLLEAEYERDFNSSPPGPEDRELVDCYILEKRLRPRKLSDVFERRVGDVLEDAHNAEADVTATEGIFLDQLGELNGEVSSISELINFQRGDYLDPEGKLKQTDGGVIVTFGKYSGKTLAWIRKNDRGYLKWMYREIDQLQPFIDKVFE